MTTVPPLGSGSLSPTPEKPASVTPSTPSPAAPAVTLGHSQQNTQGVAPPQSPGVSPPPLTDNAFPAHHLHERSTAVGKTAREKAADDVAAAKKAYEKIEDKYEKKAESKTGKKFHQLTEDEKDDHYNRPINNDKDYQEAKAKYNRLKAAYDTQYD